MKCFKLNIKKINNRFDPLFYSSDIFSVLSSSTYKTYRICDVVSYLKTGFAAGKSEQTEQDAGIIQIRPTNINEDRLLCFDKNVYINPNEVKNKQENLLKKREVLFNNTNSQDLVGKSVFFDKDGEFFCSNHITRIGVNEKIIHPFFLTTILNIYQDKKVFFNTCTNWNNQSGVNIDLLKTYRIPVPDLDTQAAIVKIIQEAYKNKSNKEIEAETIINSIENTILGQLDLKNYYVNNKKTFCVNCKEVKNKRLDAYGYQLAPRAILNAIKQSKYKDTIVPLASLILENFTGDWGEDIEKDLNDDYSVCNVIRNKNFNNVYNIDYEDIAQRKILNTKKEKILLKKGDILIEKSGGSPKQPVGRVAYIDKDIDNYVFSNFLQCIRINSELCDPEYLFIYLRTIYKLNYMKYIQSQTTGIINLLMDDFLNIPIIILKDKDAQREIVDKYNEMHNKAKQLQEEAKDEFKKTKVEVEKMILGEE